jgi:hypothetical protein
MEKGTFDSGLDHAFASFRYSLWATLRKLEQNVVTVAAVTAV